MSIVFSAMDDDDDDVAPMLMNNNMTDSLTVKISVDDAKVSQKNSQRNKYQNN